MRLTQKQLTLREAGAVLNKKNKTALQSAMATIMEVLKAAGIDLSAADDDTDANEAGGFNTADLMTLLAGAIVARLPGDTYDTRAQVYDLYDDYVIVRIGYAGAFYKIPFSVTDDGIVTLDQPVLVIRKVQYIEPGSLITANESDPGIVFEDITSPITLLERAVRADGTIPVKLIAPGKGSSGNYGADMLREYGPRVFKKGTQMLWDHPTPDEERSRPEGSLHNLAAVLKTDAVYQENGKAGPGLYADAYVYEPYRNAVNDMANDIGISIRASGRAVMADIDGVRMPDIKAITGVKTIDFVTRAGAGGQVVTMFESKRGGVVPDTTTNIVPATLDVAPIGDQEMTAEEMQALIAASITEAIKPFAAQITALQEANQRGVAAGHVTQQLHTLKVPAIVHDRVRDAALQAIPRTDTGAINLSALTESVRMHAAQELQFLQSAGVPITYTFAESGATPTDDKTDYDKELADAFGAWGLNEAQIKIAVTGRDQFVS